MKAYVALLEITDKWKIGGLILFDLPNIALKNPTISRYCQSARSACIIHWSPGEIDGNMSERVFHIKSPSRYRDIVFDDRVGYCGPRRKKPTRHCTVGRMTMKSTRRVLDHSLLRSLVHSHRSLIHLLLTAYCSPARGKRNDWMS